MYSNDSGVVWLPPFGVFADMNCMLYDGGCVITSTLDMCRRGNMVGKVRGISLRS